MKDKILFHMNIMWYESEMINETLDSILNAKNNSTAHIDFVFVLNSQTSYQKPLTGNSYDMFDRFKDHPLLKNSMIVEKTDDHDDFNVGNLRKDCYNKNYKYTVWGESDCLLPEDFFHILQNIEIKDKHVLSFSTKKMWDDSWRDNEHVYVREKSIQNIPEYLRHTGYINQSTLNDVNSKFDIIIDVIENGKQKIEGPLTCISGGFENQFVSGQGFYGEDTSLEAYLKLYSIPQYIVSTRMKGHNIYHQNKKKNVNFETIDHDGIEKFKNECFSIQKNFIQSLIDDINKYSENKLKIL